MKKLSVRITRGGGQYQTARILCDGELVTTIVRTPDDEVVVAPATDLVRVCLGVPDGWVLLHEDLSVDPVVFETEEAVGACDPDHEWAIPVYSTVKWAGPGSF